MTEFKIYDVFVGREDAIQFLENEMNKRKGKAVENVIHIIQAPGIGKTRLVNEFIKKVECERKAIGFNIFTPETRHWIDNEMLNIVGRLWRAVFLPVIKEDLPEYMFDFEVEELVEKYNLEDYEPYHKFKELINESIQFDLFLKFAERILPSLNISMVLVFDEIQTILSMLEGEWSATEDLVPRIIKLLADLIKLPNVLVVIVGTDYRTIYYLERDGSPLKGKLQRYLLEPLKHEDVKEFYTKAFGEPRDEFEQELREWLASYSNGVARTMIWMAEEIRKKEKLEEARKMGFEKGKELLSEQAYKMSGRSMRYSVMTLVEMKKGEEILEWLTNRPLNDLFISFDEMHARVPRGDIPNVCTVEELINLGVIHFVKNGYEIRNFYYHKALKYFFNEYKKR